MIKMKLDPKYYDYILKGTKRVEIRLLDEKRKNIKIKDIITFYKLPNLEESFKVEVTNIKVYNSFSELINNYNIDLLSSKNNTKKELIESLNKIYSKEKQDMYQVIAIEFKVL